MTRETINVMVGKLTRLAHYIGRAKGEVCPFLLVRPPKPVQYQSSRAY